MIGAGRRVREVSRIADRAHPRASGRHRLGLRVTFGIVGIFVGPVLLAIAYTLLDNWVRSAPAGDGTAHATGITTNSPSSTPTR